jgi:hypothetical protein
VWLQFLGGLVCFHPKVCALTCHFKFNEMLNKKCNVSHFMVYMLNKWHINLWIWFLMWDKTMDPWHHDINDRFPLMLKCQKLKTDFCLLIHMLLSILTILLMFWVFLNMRFIFSNEPKVERCLNYDWIFCGTLCFIAFIMRTMIYILHQVHI